MDIIAIGAGRNGNFFKFVYLNDLNINTAEKTTSQVLQEIQNKNLKMNTIIKGQWLTTDMPTGVENGEIEIKVMKESPDTVFDVNLGSTSVSPYSWDLKWRNGTIVMNWNPSTGIKAVDCTLAEYNDMEYHDPDTYYNIIDDIDVLGFITSQNDLELPLIYDFSVTNNNNLVGLFVKTFDSSVKTIIIDMTITAQSTAPTTSTLNIFYKDTNNSGTKIPLDGISSSVADVRTLIELKLDKYNCLHAKVASNINGESPALVKEYLVGKMANLKQVSVSTNSTGVLENAVVKIYGK